jgi:hypothetical protein
MKILLYLLLLSLITFSTEAQESKDENIFAYSNSDIQFSTETEMIAFIQNEKPSTYIYFKKLSDSLKKKVFRKHQEDLNKDLTEIVLTIYRNKK